MASQVPTELASLKVFGIPELAHLICATAAKRDCVSLMRVCRQLFYYILPFVWEEVDEANPLVSLIPGGGIVTHDAEFSPYRVMELPGSLELSRFNIYAPHVKRLTPSTFCVDEYTNWKGFLSCTQSVHLLPNLEALYLPAHDNTQHTAAAEIEVDLVNWITAFLSASLRTLVLTSPEAFDSNRSARWLNFDLANRLMKSVSQKCPGLCSVNLLPGDVKVVGSPWSFSSYLWVSFSCDSPEIYSNLLHLKNLSSLLISPAMLSPEALVALSSLPNLQSLRVLGLEGNRQVYGSDLQIPIEAFPVLKDLELKRLTWDTVANLCNTKALVAKLHSMTIWYPCHSGDNLDGDQTILSKIISSLAANNSGITSLSVRDSGHRMDPPVLEAWSRLPLVQLHLGWSVRRYYGFDALCSVLSRLPLLEDLKLSMSQDAFELTQLRKIVELFPRLRRIRIPVKWGSITQLISADFKPCRSQSNVPLHIKSNFYLPRSEQEGAIQLAGYLSILRPAAPIICEAYQPYFYHHYATPSRYVDEQPKDMINVELSRLKFR